MVGERKRISLSREELGTIYPKTQIKWILQVVFIIYMHIYTSIYMHTHIKYAYNSKRKRISTGGYGRG